MESVGKPELNTVEECIKKIWRGGDDDDMEYPYRCAFEMVIRKRGEMLYNGVKKLITNHLQNKAQELVDSQNADFLSAFLTAWEDHKASMKKICDVVKHMDKVYVIKARVPDMRDTGLEIFRNHVVLHSEIKQKLTSSVLGLVARERSGEEINRTAIGRACKILIEVNMDDREVYKELFEEPLLKHLSEFYQGESQKLLKQNSASEYINKVKEIIRDELNRACDCFDPSSEEAITAVLKKELIVQHLQKIVDMKDSGVIYLMNNDKKAELRSMYELYRRVENGVEALHDAVSVYMCQQGQHLAESKGAIEFVQRCMEIKDRIEDVVDKSFKNSTIFQEMIRHNFEHFMNSNKNKASQFLSLYVNDVILNAKKKYSDKDAARLFDKLLGLFRSLPDKAHFSNYYARHLSRRLFDNTSDSHDWERSMIGKLKDECGSEFTKKLETMMGDAELSMTFNEEFKRQNQALSSRNRGIYLTVQVLTHDTWPVPKAPKCILPEVARLAFDNFKTFYLDKSRGRKLTVHPIFGSAELDAKFYGTVNQPHLESVASTSPSNPPTDRNYILEVNTLQMIVLMLFNGRDELSLEELQKQTEIPEKDLIPALLPLACGKTNQRILVKQPAGKQINPTDSFRVNDNFTSKKRRIRGVAQNPVEAELERKQVNEETRKIGSLGIEAFIMRTLKSRKKMKHAELMEMIVEELKGQFSPNKTLVKERIESLIDREFMERSATDRTMYIYLA